MENKTDRCNCLGKYVFYVYMAASLHRPLSHHLVKFITITYEHVLGAPLQRQSHQYHVKLPRSDPLAVLSTTHRQLKGPQLLTLGGRVK